MHSPAPGAKLPGPVETPGAASLGSHQGSRQVRPRSGFTAQKPKEHTVSLIKDMLDSHPAGASDVDMDALAACIEACFDCVQTCSACADACLSEDMLGDMVTCIRTDLDCAEVCAATGKVLSRAGKSYASAVELIKACAAACRRCGEECEQHASAHDHCRICAETCHRCAAACDALLLTISA